MDLVRPWGSNAVNGVINIIAQSAANTQGAFAEAGVGTEERALAAAQYGGETGDRGLPIASSASMRIMPPKDYLPGSESR